MSGDVLMTAARKAYSIRRQGGAWVITLRSQYVEEMEEAVGRFGYVRETPVRDAQGRTTGVLIEPVPGWGEEASDD